MSVDQAEKAELACVYAGLLLHDAGVEISADKISKLLKESGNKVDDYYPEFFAGFLKTCDIKALLSATPSAAPAAAAAPATEEKKDELIDQIKKLYCFEDFNYQKPYFASKINPNESQNKSEFKTNFPSEISDELFKNKFNESYQNCIKNNLYRNFPVKEKLKILIEKINNNKEEVIKLIRYEGLQEAIKFLNKEDFSKLVSIFNEDKYFIVNLCIGLNCFTTDQLLYLIGAITNPQVNKNLIIAQLI